MGQEIEHSRFVQQTFIYKNEYLNVVIAPEFQPTNEGVEWTEFYLGLLIHPTSGSFTFRLEPAPHDIRWEAKCEYSFDRELVEIIADIIEAEFQDHGRTW